MTADYELTWIDDDLAVGHAPMSYEDLAYIRDQGVSAIVNLCGEYCDLHDIQTGDGFDVHYLPVMDECAPDMEKLEAALDWIEASIEAGKKVLIHCRFGVGRTGTLVTAHLMRRGMDMKEAAKALKGSRATPTNYCQWKLLRKYRKKTGD